jgi:hypothetical protein
MLFSSLAGLACSSKFHKETSASRDILVLQYLSDWLWARLAQSLPSIGRFYSDSNLEGLIFMMMRSILN